MDEERVYRMNQDRMHRSARMRDLIWRLWGIDHEVATRLAEEIWKA